MLPSKISPSHIRAAAAQYGIPSPMFSAMWSAFILQSELQRPASEEELKGISDEQLASAIKPCYKISGEDNLVEINGRHYYRHLVDGRVVLFFGTRVYSLHRMQYEELIRNIGIDVFYNITESARCIQVKKWRQRVRASFGEVNPEATFEYNERIKLDAHEEYPEYISLDTLVRYQGDTVFRQDSLAQDALIERYSVDRSYEPTRVLPDVGVPPARSSSTSDIGLLVSAESLLIHLRPFAIFPYDEQ